MMNRGRVNTHRISRPKRRNYTHRMPKKPPRADWPQWSQRFTDFLKDRQRRSLPSIADEMGLTVGGVRHWLNGHRQILLIQFFKLCEVAQADPQEILFGKTDRMSDRQRQMLDAYDSAPDHVRRAIDSLLNMRTDDDVGNVQNGTDR